MSGHTEGPWELGAEGNGAVGSVYCNNSMGSRVAIVFGKGQEYSVFSDAEEAANARLIAAAPELLEALQAVVADKDWRTNDNTLWPRITAAVLKATTP